MKVRPSPLDYDTVSLQTATNLHDEQGKMSPLYYDQMFKIFDPVEVTPHLGTTEYRFEALEPHDHFGSWKK